MPPPEPIPARGSVLLVDDEEIVGRLVRRHLRGWTVTQAFSLTAGHDLIGPTLELVILDLNLGDTSYPHSLLDNPLQGSFGFAHRIRQRLPSLPVVIFSGCCNPANGDAARYVGAEFLSKHEAAANLALLRGRLEQQAIPSPSPVLAPLLTGT
jgi:CheY-like chemotaxis protein